MEPWTSKTKNKFSPEVRERAVRMVLEHEAITPRAGRRSVSIAARSAARRRRCTTGWQQAERDSGIEPGTHDRRGRERLKALERENRELRQANEILRKASAYFAQAELDRRFKP